MGAGAPTPRVTLKASLIKGKFIRVKKYISSSFTGLCQKYC